MSAIAMNWLSRQRVEDRALSAVLAVLATAADRDGVCAIGQTELRKRAGMKERALRNALHLLERFHVLHFIRSSSGRSGRAADRVALSLKASFDISRGEIRAARRVGATGTNLWVQPASGAGAPTELSARAHYARTRVISSSPEASRQNPLRGSERSWWDAQRGQWRTRFRFDGIDLDLGRFATKQEADAAHATARADVLHAHSHSAGTPRDPVTRPSVQEKEGADLCDFLFGAANELYDEADREADGPGLGDDVPDGVARGKAPASTDRSKTTVTPAGCRA